MTSNAFPSKRALYAALAMMELARHFGAKRAIAAKDLAKRFNLSPNYLLNILQTLRAAGLIKSTRGALGGYQLALPPEQIALGYILTVIEPSHTTSDDDVTTDETNANGARSTTANRDATPELFQTRLYDAWRQAENKRQEFLNALLLSQLIEPQTEETILNFTI